MLDGEKRKPGNQKSSDVTFEGFLAWLKAKKDAGEVPFEVGMDEAWKANMKRLFDEYLNQSLNEQRKTDVLDLKHLVTKMGSEHLGDVFAAIALQSAITTIDLVGKAAAENFNLIGAQKLEAKSVATDRTWNFDIEAMQLLTALGLGEIVKNLKSDTNAAKSA